MNDHALFESKPSLRQLWQRYWIFPDRLELRTLFGPIVLPFAHVERLEVAEPALKSLFRFRFDFAVGLKLDFADLFEHVVLESTEKRIGRILFTPEDPAEFKRVFDAAFARWRAGREA